MHISRIELENIKAYASAAFDFSRGTTAITGENGAGKTTIIEAIAWTLFDLLEYKKEDFVRRGTKKGSVRVTFESSLDEREYIVYRDSGAGYHVTDPRLGIRLADKKEEVFRFLWQHLGLEPGTDLKSLFRQAIGVPQGTFTAIFLEGSTERKSAFDRLLKVEEYRQAAEKLRDTSRFLDTSIAGIRVDIARAEGELTRAQTVEEEHRSYLEQTTKLASDIETLEKMIAAKRILVEKLDEMERIENAVVLIKAEQKHVLENLERTQKAHQEIGLLKPKLVEQESLDREVISLREKNAHAKAIADQLKSIDERIERLRMNYRANADQIKEAEEKAKNAAEVPTLEKRGTELITQLATLNARLESDEKFQSQIKGGLCPIISEKCLNLKPGETLETFVSHQFTDLRSRISSFEHEQALLTTNLKSAREAERIAATLGTMRQRLDELGSEGKQLSSEKAELEKKSFDLADLEKEVTEIEAKIKVLGDPKSRTQYLENEIEREPELRRKITEIESNLERLETERKIIIEHLEEHNYVLESGYDNTQHITERNALHDAEKRNAEFRATFDAARKREKQLAAELQRFAELRKSLQKEFREKERLENVAETTSFIRDTLKEAAPRVARNYVHHVSIEANQMFREITGNGERTLKWAEDYSIVLEENGYERPFQSFSGGEQMSAALAVRLAILKQLSDVRIAFFDEPTTNLDSERRENFAQQISLIKHFDQLFVISHDDTFDSYVDNVIAI
jgi:DNA repair protein SbcC/Rad50